MKVPPEAAIDGLTLNRKLILLLVHGEQYRRTSIYVAEDKTSTNNK